ncbi:MAG: transketolase [Candidatus Thorarchaeota archaeon SMTZ1-83]|nr:MAG: transketolase [Candidatus Thorarchaeota archaeon SMTZ1-83]
MSELDDLQNRAINTIRFLAADAVQKANSGHPGMPMGTAALAYTLWTRHLRFNPRNPEWSDRDRFVLSGGHGSMLLYALLHLTGYDLSLDDIKNFRQWGCRTPGHPENFCTPGVEVTTGPLGQGMSNALGMAIAERHLAALFNRPDHEIVNHYTYAIVTDGDLMEGLSYETASLAGHHQLGKLILLYDDNQISIDGSTDITFTEHRGARFESLGWHVQSVADGNDVVAIDQAISNAKRDQRPSIIMVRTHIGYGMPNKQDTAKAHGEPPGDDELDAAKNNLGWPLEPRFLIPDDVLEHFREAITNGEELENAWHVRMENYRKEHPDLAEEFERRLSGRLPKDWDKNLPIYEADETGVATRNPSGDVINALAPHLPELFGGSADLTGSNKTWIKDQPAFQKDSPEGRNFFFGIREHAMGAIVNGMSAHGGFIPYGATFLIFSDYMRPAIRLSALSKHRSIWVFTHDSIGVGEDGPTHQPVEQLAALRAIPDLVVLRPCDANEVVEAWKIAINRSGGPTLISLTRQKIPILDRNIYSPASGLGRGAYVLTDFGDGPLDIIMMATGSEVSLITKAGEKLAQDGVNVRLVSFPSWELFGEQGEDYRNSVLPPDVKARLAVEAGRSQGWERWVGDKGTIMAVEKFGASAPDKVVFEKYGFTVDNVIMHVRALLEGK